MDNLLSLVYCISSLSYTILAGHGKFICFIFGIFASLLYSFISYKNALWGTLALNILYYIPIQILSLIKWQKHTFNSTVKKTSLAKLEFGEIILIGFILSLICYYILFLNKDREPFLDGFILIFSIIGTYFTLRRAIEQWIIWTIVNLLTVVMWVDLVLKGSKSYFNIVLWFSYLILGIIFYFKWKKEITSNQQ